MILKALSKYKPLFLDIYFINIKQDNNSHYIISLTLEKCKYSLYDARAKGIIFSERDLKLFLMQLLKSYLILKQKRIVHSDVSAVNILISLNSSAKLCDFEHSYYYHKKINPDNLPKITPKGYINYYYLSPEIFFWAKHPNLGKIKYDPFKSDTFSLGLSILYYLTGSIQGLNNYEDTNNAIRRQLLNGFKYYKNDYNHYIEYNKTINKLQSKIDAVIDNLQGYTSITEILKSLLTVDIEKRDNIETLFKKINKINCTYL